MADDPTGTEAEFRHKGGSSTWLTAVAVVSLVVAVVAVGLAAWAVWRPRSTAVSQPSYSDSQRADAKRSICAAMELVREGVTLNTNLRPAGGPADVTGSLAVAANARLSLSDGGQYLLSRMDPATPDSLASSVKAFAHKLLDIGAAATAGIANDNPEQAARLREADATNATVTDLCK